MIRREFLKMTGIAVATTAFGSRALVSPSPALAQETSPTQVAWIENGEPAALLQAALKEMGGMSRFVSNGDVVVIKPNMGWDRTPELAGNTNPELVAEVVKECLNAGAKKVKIFDRTCNNPQRCYASCGIEEAATAVGAEVSQIQDERFKSISIKNGEIVKEWSVYQDYLEADKVINIPIAKHHKLARVTLGIKNLMGVLGNERGQIHQNFEKKINDIVGQILPTLTIIDAYRMLIANGPSGGNPADVKMAKSLIMSPCTISADLTALGLFGLKLEEIPYLKEAIARKMNEYDIASLKVKKVSLS